MIGIPIVMDNCVVNFSVIIINMKLIPIYNMEKTFSVYIITASISIIVQNTFKTKYLKTVNELAQSNFSLSIIMLGKSNPITKVCANF